MPQDGDHCQRRHRVAGLPHVCVLIGLGETRKRERSAIAAARADGPSPSCTTWRPPGPRRPPSPSQLEVLATAWSQQQICGTCGNTWVRVWGAGRECGYCREARIGGWLAVEQALSRKEHRK